MQLIDRNAKDETSGSEDEEASPDIGHDICLETYTGSVTVTQNIQLEDHICPFLLFFLYTVTIKWMHNGGLVCQSCQKFQF